MKLKINSILFLAILTLVNYTLLAQSSSSYTRFGIGDVDYSYSVRRMGMGQLGASIADVDFISIINPASLYRLGKTRIEFSVNYNGTFLANDIQKNYYAETDFGGFTVGIPISNKYGVGVAFGLVPFSNISYKVLESSNSINPLIGDYQIEYSGNGGLSKVFVSSSYLLPIDMAVGGSFEYYFGNINYNSRVAFIGSSSYSSEYLRNYQNRGIGGTFGFISPDFSKFLDLKSITDFRLGFALNLISKINDDTMLTAISVVGIDTLSSGRGEINIPAKISLGMSFVLHNKYLFSLDYSSQAWSKYLINKVSSSVLRNAFKISGGFEYRPVRELGSTFWEQIILRAGLSYEQTQYFIYDKGINQFSVSVGASLPLSYENTLDFGLIYSRRGTKELNLLQEDIIKFGIGFSLGELWFLRQDK
jgi:hypothetical protein